MPATPLVANRLHSHTRDSCPLQPFPYKPADSLTIRYGSLQSTTADPARSCRVRSLPSHYCPSTTANSHPVRCTRFHYSHSLPVLSATILVASRRILAYLPSTANPLLPLRANPTLSRPILAFPLQPFLSMPCRNVRSESVAASPILVGPCGDGTVASSTANH